MDFSDYLFKCFFVMWCFLFYCFAMFIKCEFFNIMLFFSSYFRFSHSCGPTHRGASQDELKCESGIVLASSLNHFNWLFSVWRSSSLMRKSSRITELLTVNMNPFLMSRMCYHYVTQLSQIKKKQHQRGQRAQLLNLD